MLSVKDLDPVIQGDYVTNESQNRVFFEWDKIPKEIRCQPELKFKQINSATEAFRTQGDGTSTYGSFVNLLFDIATGVGASGRIGQRIRIKRVEFAHYNKNVLILDRQPYQSTTFTTTFPADGDFYNAKNASGGYLRNYYYAQRFSLIAPKELNQNVYRQSDPFGTESMVTVDMDLPVVYSNEYAASSWFVCYNNLFLYTPQASGNYPVLIRIYYTDE